MEILQSCAKPQPSQNFVEHGVVFVSCSLQWRHNGRNGVSNHQHHYCLLNSLKGADQRKHQSSASLALGRGIHRWPVNSPHKWPVTRKMLPFDDVIMFKLPANAMTTAIRSATYVAAMSVYVSKLGIKWINSSINKVLPSKWGRYNVAA